MGSFGAIPTYLTVGNEGDDDNDVILYSIEHCSAEDANTALVANAESISVEWARLQAAHEYLTERFGSKIDALQLPAMGSELQDVLIEGVKARTRAIERYNSAR